MGEKQTTLSGTNAALSYDTQTNSFHLQPHGASTPCLEGIIWVLTSGARWKDLPERYPSPATCWRRLREWSDDGRFLAAWEKLLGKLDRLKGINWEEAIGDGSFVRAKKGAPTSATAARARAPQSC